MATPTKASTTRGNSPSHWVLAVDGSEHSDEAARYVARWAGVLRVDTVWIVNAQPIESYRAYALNRDLLLKEADERAEEAMGSAKQLLDAANVNHRAQVSFDDAAEAIHEASRTHDAAEIVLGTRGRGALTSLVLGSTAYKVIHMAERAVTVVPPSVHSDTGSRSSPPAQVQRVLVCVDGSEHSRRTIDYMVRSAGSAPGSLEVHLLHVRSPAMPRTGVGAASIEDLDRASIEAGEAVLASSGRTLADAGIRHQSELMMGSVAECIAKAGMAKRCARIVLGSRGLGPMRQMVLGSVAYQVIHQGALPVTVVK